MTRRELIILLGSTALWPLGAEARTLRRSRTLPHSTADPPSRLVFNGGEPVEPGRLLTIAAVGDVLLHSQLQSWASQHSEGYSSLFHATRDLIGAADIAFANLEGPAAQGVSADGRNVPAPKTLFDNNVFSGYPQFNYHPSITGELKHGGFTVLNTANNHALDRQQLGADRTIEAIKAANLAFTGSRHRDEMTAPWYAVTSVKIADDTFNVAWLGSAYDTNGIPDHAKQILNCYADRDDIRGMVQDLSRRPDIHAVILTPHWGVEYENTPEAIQIAWAKEMIEAGATAIIGQHPHVVQPIVKLTTDDGRDAPVAYSLGNFVSGQVGIACRSSAILVLGLTPTPNGRLTTAALGWIPLWMAVADGYYAEPTARSKSAEAKAYQNHVAQYVVAQNILAPGVPFWRFPSPDLPAWRDAARLKPGLRSTAGSKEV